MSDDKVHDVQVYLDGEGRFEWASKLKLREGMLTHIAALPRGLSSGRASLVLFAKLQDGTTAFIQSSLLILLQAAKAFEARYGPEADGVSKPLNEATKERMQAALLVSVIKQLPGAEVTLNVDDVNAVMQGTEVAEVVHSEDRKHITFRMARSE